MTKQPETFIPKAKLIQQAFDAVLSMEKQKKDIGDQITDYIDGKCEQFSMTKKGFKIAVKWYSMTDGQRQDFEDALRFAQQALGDHNQPDLFDQNFEARETAEIKQFRGHKDIDE